MSGYYFDRPYIEADKLKDYRAIDRAFAMRYGKLVKATDMSNVEYKLRFDRLNGQRSMKPPPSCRRIFDGFLVVRQLGRPDQYETWIPAVGFEDAYEAVNG